MNRSEALAVAHLVAHEILDKEAFAVLVQSHEGTVMFFHGARAQILGPDDHGGEWIGVFSEHQGDMLFDSTEASVTLFQMIPFTEGETTPTDPQMFTDNGVLIPKDMAEHYALSLQTVLELGPSYISRVDFEGLVKILSEGLAKASREQ